MLYEKCTIEGMILHDSFFLKISIANGKSEHSLTEDNAEVAIMDNIPICERAPQNIQPAWQTV